MNPVAGLAYPSLPVVTVRSLTGYSLATMGAVVHLDVLRRGVVPGERIELSLCFQNRILSPARLPVPPPRHASTDGAELDHPKPEGAQYMRGFPILPEPK